MEFGPEEELVTAGDNLDLLSTPALVGLAHVGRGFNGGNELEGHVCDTDEADQRTVNDAKGAVVQQDGTDKDVDYGLISHGTCLVNSMRGKQRTDTAAQEGKEE